MTLNSIRTRYLDFFKAPDRKHQEIPATSVVPENDPTTLFTSSGMQQLVPYLKGEPHPMGQRLVDSQPSIRIEDINEIGDNRHITFFEMLGNWSLGDYFKAEQLSWLFTFLTQELMLDHEKLFVTVFSGNEIIPEDTDSIALWQKLFKTKQRAKPGKNGFDPTTKIYTYPAQKNWWSRAGVPANMPIGEIGGPDSEIFYDFGAKLKLHEISAFAGKPCHVNCDCGRFMEIGNSVFMEYVKEPDGSFMRLPAQNVDFGGGLERIVAATNNNPDVFTIDVFQPLISLLETASGKKYQTSFQPPMRIIADHLRASTFILASGIEPSNKLQGYILRRLLRRSVLKAKQLEIRDIADIFNQIISHLSHYYPENLLPAFNLQAVQTVVSAETTKFEQALKNGLKELEKHSKITGKVAFDLLQSYGFPWELTLEIAKDKGQEINQEEFETEFKKHQELSRSGSKGLFKGGLADHSDTIVKYHTTTHLLHQALRQILGDHVQQMGSNITGERLRFDFKHHQKMTEVEKQNVIDLINAKIEANLPVTKNIEPKSQALKSGALAFFREKYPDSVSVYTIGTDPNKNWFSKELCGGPHVASTGLIGPVRMTKEEAVGAGVRRVYLTLAS